MTNVDSRWDPETDKGQEVKTYLNKECTFHQAMILGNNIYIFLYPKGQGEGCRHLENALTFLDRRPEMFLQRNL